MGNCSDRFTPTHSLVITADKFTFVSDGNVTCHPLVVRKLPYDKDSRDRGSPKSIWFIKAMCDAAYDDDAPIEEYVFIDYKGSLVMVSK